MMIQALRDRYGKNFAVIVCFPVIADIDFRALTEFAADTLRAPRARRFPRLIRICSRTLLRILLRLKLTCNALNTSALATRDARNVFEIVQIVDRELNT